MSNPQQPEPSRLRTLLTLAWPVVVARSSQAVIGFCDALMSASLGESALAAVTAGALNVFAFIILPMGLVFIVQSFSAQLVSRGEEAAARRYAWYGLILAGVVQILALCAWPLIGSALGFFSYEPAVHEAMRDYIQIRLLAVGAVVAVEALGNWFGGLGNTHPHMFAGLISMIVNVVLNWVLIHGNLGAPALGVKGAALASLIASLVGLAYLVMRFLRARPTNADPDVVRLRGHELLRMLRFGLPNGINWFLEFGAFLIFINVVVADLGTSTLAAMMVVFNVNSVSFMPAFGLSSAGAILAGQAIGADKKDEVWPILRTTMLVAGAWQCAVGIIYVAAPGLLIQLFAPPDQDASELIAVGTTLLAISAAWQIFDAVAMSFGEALRSAGDTTWTMGARLFIAWAVFTPAGLIVVKVMGGGHVAAMLCVVSYLGLLAMALAFRFRSGAWRNIDLTGLGEPSVDG